MQVIEVFVILKVLVISRPPPPATSGHTCVALSTVDGPQPVLYRRQVGIHPVHVVIYTFCCYAVHTCQVGLIMGSDEFFELNPKSR